MKPRSNGKWPAHRQRIGLWGALGLALLLPNSPTALAAEHDVPLFMRASHDRQEGFVRIINRSDEDGAVRVRAIDDSGRTFDPVSLSLGARQALHFNSDDLETGNAQKGITGTGSGTGNWRLKLESSLDIEVLAYVRTTDGFLSSMHDLVRKPSTNHLVPTFNPGDNHNQVSRLRLINPSANDAAVTVVGVDDQGSRTPPVSLTLSAREARSITAQQLESGHSSLNGRLGDGNGKWRLFVSADAPIQVMSLLESPTGHLTNLSTSTSMRDYAPPPDDSSPPDGPDVVVDIPDPILKRSIAEALNKDANDAITKAEIASLKELHTGGGISDLTGLQFATGLTELVLINNPISDISVLSNLVGLTRLDIAGNRFSDLRPLAALTSLTTLDLSSNGIKDINPLTSLTNLRNLSIGHNHIRDVSALANLANLEYLYIRNNNIADLTPLAGLTNLTHLDVLANSFTDISMLRGLSNLTSLNLEQNRIMDFAVLSGLTNLRELHLDATGFTDILLLQKLIHLRELSLTQTQLTDISILSRMTRLTRLYVGYNSIADISPLADLTDLEVLWINRSPIRDFSPLAGLTNLTSLHLQNTGITDLTVLKDLTKLEWLALGSGDKLDWLTLGFDKIADISPLAGLVNLEYLYILYTDISDISALRKMTKLYTLDLRGNNISNISPLAGMSRLHTLDLTDNEVSDISILENLTKLMWIRLANNEITNIPDFPRDPHSTSDRQLLELDLKDNPLSQEAQNKVAMLRDSGVLVHYNPPVASTDQFPDSPLFQIYNDNVLVMEAAANLTVHKVGDGLALDAYAREFYKHFEDDFDFLLFLSNLDDHSEFNGDVYYGAYLSVMNDTEGTGLGIHFNNEFGSDRKLRGAIHFPYNRGLVEGPGLHELMHAWANYAIPSVEGAHWGFSSANGQLGGFDLAKLASLGSNRYSAGNFGTVANGGNGVPYSPIELYFAGYVPPEIVPDLWVAADGAWSEETGVFTASEVRDYSIEDIIAQHGQRVPNVSEAQWNYRAAAILLVSDDHPPSTAQLRLLSEQVAAFVSPHRDDSRRYNYYEATGNRGTITMNGLSRLRKPAPGAALLPASFGKAPPPRFCWPDGRGGFMHKPLEKRIVLPLSGRGDLRHQAQRLVPVGG